MSDRVTKVHREDVEAVVASVFATMMSLDARPAPEPCPGTAGMLTASVYLTGEWSGAACLYVEPARACFYAARFLGMPAADAVDDDVRDVMGELANMIAGNLKCTLAPGIRVSVPSVTDGSEYSVRVCGAREVCRAGFDTDVGQCWISVIEAGPAGD